MYETKQNKERVSRRIDCAGDGARQKVKMGNQKRSSDKKILQAEWDWRSTGANNAFTFWHPYNIPGKYSYAQTKWEVLHISKSKTNQQQDHVTTIIGDRYNLFRDGGTNQTNPPAGIMSRDQIKNVALGDFDQEQRQPQTQLPIITHPGNLRALNIVRRQ